MFIRTFLVRIMCLWKVVLGCMFPTPIIGEDEVFIFR